METEVLPNPKHKIHWVLFESHNQLVFKTMNSIQSSYILKLLSNSTPFSEAFSESEKYKLALRVFLHIKTMPRIIFSTFYLGTLVFGLFPILNKIPIVKKVKQLIDRLIKTILLLYISEKLGK